MGEIVTPLLVLSSAFMLIVFAIGHFGGKDRREEHKQQAFKDTHNHHQGHA